MKKEFIPYEQALSLKELGFNELCFGWWSWINGNQADYYKYEISNQELIILGNHKNNCSAPIFSQAFRWFREKYDLRGYVIDTNMFQTYSFMIADKINKDFINDGIDFSTYEEAELECLKKLIEIVKNKQS